MKNFFLLTFILIHFFLNAQELQLKGRIVDFFSNKPIPFATIEVNDNKYAYMADVNGEFSIPNVGIKKLIFKHYPQLPLIMTVDTFITKTLEIKLYSLVFSEKTNLNDNNCSSLIKQIISQKPRTNTIPHAYFAYNKFHIDTDEQQTTTQILNNIIKRFTKKRIEWTGGEHRFFLMESLSKINYENKTNQKEIVYATKVTGLKNTALFNINAGLQFLSIYNKRITIAQNIHISPLSLRGLKRYNYSIVDTIFTITKTLLVIRYTPNKRTFFEGIQGLMYINLDDYGVEYFEASPIGQQKSKIEVSQKYEKVGLNGIRFPLITTTTFQTKESTNHKIRLLATIKTYIYNYQELPNLKGQVFDDCSIEYLDSTDYVPDSVWIKNRQESIVTKDLNTILFFNQIGNFKKVDKVINVGSRIYSGLIPVKMLNIRLNKLVSYNDFEGLRLGFGLETNEIFNTTYSVGGYYGYGFKDNLEKYGINASYILDKKGNLVVKILAQQELYEPGRTEFIFDRQQYSSEPLRKYRIPRMDFVDKYDLSINWEPYKYLKTYGVFEIENLQPKYEYKFNADSLTTFHFNELGVGIRYAFGEKNIKYNNKKVLLSTKFPVVQFQFTKGINAAFGNFNYDKIDVKLSYDVKILGYGRHIIQLTGGYANGEIPYMKLYNSKGSFRNFYAVIHNSFETMAFNEFISDKYTTLFYSVNLGKLNKFKKFRPTLELSQNIGYGTLSSKNEHQYITYKTMEKGYYESGITFGNLIELHTFGLKTGLGISLYYRYGTYAFNENSKNLIFKLATNFRI